MREAEIGRVLVASLHQGIADVLPMRLGFYEGWLNAEGMRGGTIGVAALSAVLSFLRREGEAYNLVTSRAGDYAATWTVESMSLSRRALLRRLPSPLRRRFVLRVGRRLVRESYQQSSAVSRLRRGTATVTLRSSIFCTVRDPVTFPLCGFYAAAFTRLLVLFDLPAHAAVVTCRATGSEVCTLTVADAEPSDSA